MEKPQDSATGGKRRRGLKDRYFGFVERLYVYLHHRTMATAQTISDIYTFLQEWIKELIWMMLKIVTAPFGAVVLSSGHKNKFVRFAEKILKFAIGVPYLIITFCILMIFTLIAGAVAGIVGLRNIGEYTVKEQIFAWIVAIVVLILLPEFVGTYFLYKVSMCCIFAIILVGLNFLYGQCGIVALGHAAFVLVGAYLTTLFYNAAFGFSLPFVLAIILGSFLTGLFSLIIGAPSLRIKDEYLIIITIAFTVAVPQFIRSRYLSPFCGGSQEGIQINRIEPPFFSDWITPDMWSYFFIAGAAVVLIGISYNLQLNSQIGRAFRMIRCDDVIARAQGINVAKYKMLAFALSAFYAAFAGGLMMMINPYVSSESYNAFDSIDYFIGLVIGGPGSVLGSVIGGSFLAYEADMIKSVAGVFYHGQSFMRMVYGAILIFMVYFFPEGIAGMIRSTVRKLFLPKLRRGTYYMRPPPDYDFLSAKDYRDIDEAKL
jgi:branched-chain amino acid transport system permease protein